MPVSPPRPKGPPLNALRAFEAAARLGGIALAAEELCVTPGAVSQHIKAMEDWAGEALFERRSQGVRPTALGARLAPGLTTGFDQLGLALHAMRQARPKPNLTIAALPSVAQLWLPARLPSIRRRLPSFNISVTALENPPNLRRDLFDCSIFIRERSEVEAGKVLAEDLIFPVCAPAVAARLRSPADLARETLLHDGVWQDDWRLWASQANVPLAEAAIGPHFSLYSIVLEEAKSGAGILIGHQCLVENALRTGELVKPFAQTVPTGKVLMLELPGPQAPESAAALMVESLLEPSPADRGEQG